MSQKKTIRSQMLSIICGESPKLFDEASPNHASRALGMLGFSVSGVRGAAFSRSRVWTLRTSMNSQSSDLIFSVEYQYIRNTFGDSIRGKRRNYRRRVAGLSHQVNFSPRVTFLSALSSPKFSEYRYSELPRASKRKESADTYSFAGTSCPALCGFLAVLTANGCGFFAVKTAKRKEKPRFRNPAVFEPRLMIATKPIHAANSNLQRLNISRRIIFIPIHKSKDQSV